MSQEEAHGVIAAQARAGGRLMTDNELDRVTGGIMLSIDVINPARKEIEPGAESAANKVAGSV